MIRLVAGALAIAAAGGVLAQPDAPSLSHEYADVNGVRLHYVAAGQQGRPVFAEPAQVVRRRQVGLLQVAGGLGGGQRQVAEFGGELVRQLLVQRRNPGPQQGDRLRSDQHVDL